MSGVQIIRLQRQVDDHGVYTSDRRFRGPFDTPMLFRGTREECEAYVIGQREILEAA